MADYRAAENDPEEPCERGEQTPGRAASPASRGGRGSHFFLAALVFEAGLGVLALLVGWLLGHSPNVVTVFPVPAAWSAPVAVAVGCAAAAPLLLALLLLDRYPPRSLETFRDEVQRLVIPLFRRFSLVQLAAVSACAGWGEELLYRGLLQAGLQMLIGGTWGTLIGLSVASLIFGLCHFLNRTYAILAGLVGFYLGLLFLLSGQLLTAIVAHALYDFLALLYLTRWESTPGIPQSQ